MGQNADREARRAGPPGAGVASGLLQLIRRINETVIILLFVALCLVLISQVVARYAFHSPFSWSEEMARYLQVWMVLLAAAACMQRGRHISIDFLTHYLPRGVERALGVVMNVIVIAYLLVVLRSSGELMQAASLQTTPAMGIPMLAVYLAVPTGATLLLLEALVSLVRRLSGLPPFETAGRREVD